MRSLALALVPAAAVLALALPSLPATQKRVQQKDAADFPGTLDAAQEAWTQGRYGACLSALKEATGLVTAKRIEAILAALPAAPAGFEKVEEERDQVQANQMMAGMAGLVGNIVEQEYRGPFRLRVTISADSPMVQMVTMGLSNPALLDKDTELIEYENDHKALLKRVNGGQARDFTLVVAGKHLVQVDFGSSDEDQLLAMWSQGAVDAIAAALAD